MADNGRWERFVLRSDDVVISTPSKCGTTWMQTIVGMLLLGRVDLGGPLSSFSPWLDMLIRSEAEVFALLDAQTHRRWIKTHTPLDGLPDVPSVTYIVVIRHPLDVALSDRDHGANMRTERARELRVAAAGEPDPAILAGYVPPPADPTEFLRWFIDNDRPPTGSGPHGLSDFCEQATIAWDRRHRPNVHVFHYQDLWTDLESEMGRVAAALGVEIAEPLWSAMVEGARLDSMRSRAADVAPDAQLGMWHSDDDFFRTGGPRDWASLLGPEDIEHFRARLTALAGDAAGWILNGRAALV